jgi:uncharacterized lipoprotein YajG
MKRLIAVAGLVLLVGCQAPPAEMTEAEIAQVEAEVMSWTEDWIRSATNQDADAVAALMDPADVTSRQLDPPVLTSLTHPPRGTG